MSATEKLDSFAAMMDGMIGERASRAEFNLSKHKGDFSKATRLGSGQDVDTRVRIAKQECNSTMEAANREALTFSATEGISTTTVLDRIRPMLRVLCDRASVAATGDLLSKGSRYPLTPELRARLENLRIDLIAAIATHEANARGGYVGLQRVSPLPIWRKVWTTVRENPWVLLALVITALLSALVTRLLGR